MALPKLIASDLDGTLLLEGSRSVSDRALTLISEYIRRGGVFIAASGRQTENIRDIFSPIKDEIGYICYSGGLCLYRDKVVYERYLDPALAGELVTDIEATATSEAMISAPGSELISPKEPQMYRYLTEDVGMYTSVLNDLNLHVDRAYKVSLYNKDGDIDRAYWKAKYGRRCAVLNSGSVWIDFMPTGVDKGTALRALLDRLGIAPADCVAFGDNENDKGMLQLVGCPIVMRHAAAELKGIGKYTTDTVEDMLEHILHDTDSPNTNFK